MRLRATQVTRPHTPAGATVPLAATTAHTCSAAPSALVIPCLPAAIASRLPDRAAENTRLAGRSLSPPAHARAGTGCLGDSAGLARHVRLADDRRNCGRRPLYKSAVKEETRPRDEGKRTRSWRVQREEDVSVQLSWLHGARPNRGVFAATNVPGASRSDGRSRCSAQARGYPGCYGSSSAIKLRTYPYFRALTTAAR
jgi:hypothetical protein